MPATETTTLVLLAVDAAEDKLAVVLTAAEGTGAMCSLCHDCSVAALGSCAETIVAAPDSLAAIFCVKFNGPLAALCFAVSKSKGAAAAELVTTLAVAGTGVCKCDRILAPPSQAQRSDATTLALIAE